MFPIFHYSIHSLLYTVCFIKTNLQMHGDHLSVIFPEHKYVPHMIEYLRQILLQLQRLDRSAKGVLARALLLLAEYLYLAIHTHPFLYGNFR